MPTVSPKIFEKLTELKGWSPYIESTVMVLSPRPRGKYRLAFKEADYTTEMPFKRARKLLNRR